MHSAGPDVFLAIRVVQPRERIFMKNDNRKKCRKNIELFNGETWRGAESLQARFVEEYRRFFEKHHIFKATGGAIMGGRMEGRKNGGANGWANFHMHGGALVTPISQIIPKTKWFFQ